MPDDVDIKYHVRQNDPDRYLVEDMQAPHFTLSRTTLYEGKSTRGHSHDHPEVYYFVSGKGKMEIGRESFEVGDALPVYIPGGSFHRVFNNGTGDLVFLCFWQ